MESLSKEQVAIITAGIQQAGITLFHLPDDLVDHICCEIEDLMRKGRSFEDAYDEVRLMCGTKELQKIQEDTRILTDKNYKLMKTTMKLSGLISLILLGFSTVFKIFHWPGAGIGLVLGFFILTLIFMPSAVYVNFRDEHKKKNLLLHLSALSGSMIFLTGILFKLMHWPGAGTIILTGSFILIFLFLPVLLLINLKKQQSKREKTIWITGVIALIIFALSFIFKLMHWPGAFVLMIAGSVMLFSVFLPLYSYREFKKGGRISGKYIYLITLSMFVILFTFLIAANVSRNITGSLIRQVENANDILIYMEKSNRTLYEKLELSNDSSNAKSDSSYSVLKETTQSLCDFIKDIRFQLVSQSEAPDNVSVDEKLAKPGLIKSLTDTRIVSLFMLGENKNGKGYELKKKIDEYKTKIAPLTKNAPASAILFDGILNTDDVAEGGTTQSWENHSFADKNLAGTIALLGYIEIVIRQAEYEACISIYTGNKK